MSCSCDCHAAAEKRAWWKQPLQTLLIGLVRAYQYLLSPWLGRRCRFYPSCSEYAVEALQKHGGVAGSWLTLRRLARCHPYHPGGVDLVPESFEFRKH